MDPLIAVTLVIAGIVCLVPGEPCYGGEKQRLNVKENSRREDNMNWTERPSVSACPVQ
jgi:hypothetical protein